MVTQGESDVEKRANIIPGTFISVQLLKEEERNVSGN